MPVVGFMNTLNSADSASDLVAAFRQGLRETGFVEGQNVAVEERWSRGQYDRFPELAAELVRRQADVIFAATIQAALPAKTAASTIPMLLGSSPVSTPSDAPGRISACSN